jgi:hypothetical protein
MARRKTKAPVVTSAQIEVPVTLDHSTMDTTRHINIQLDTHDGWLFRAIGLGLSRSDATLRSGQRVGHGRSFTGDTLRWILEALDDALKAD